MHSKFNHPPSAPKSTYCSSGYTILCNALDTSSSLLETFDQLRKGRKAKGTPTDEEQDLLRAMLAFAGAGLDSLAKQLVRDALPRLLTDNAGAIQMFKTFVERKIKDGDEVDRSLLADILIDRNPREKLVSMLIRDLTSNSLQSKEAILKVASYFDIPSQNIAEDVNLLDEIFKVRNQIIHEMDVDFSQPNRNRIPRAKSKMVKYTSELFRVSDAFLSEVDKRLQSIDS